MIDTIVFDIGNVLADYAWLPFVQSFQFEPEIEARVIHATFQSPTWIEYDRGIWTDEQIIESFIQHDPDVKTQILRTQQSLSQVMGHRPSSIPWIQHLKRQGYRVLYLSNFPRRMHEECIDALDFLPETDGGVMSYEVQHVKPDRGIYQALVEKYELEPSRCIFLDDVVANLDGAAQLGFHTLLVEDPHVARVQLDHFLEQHE